MRVIIEIYSRNERQAHFVQYLQRFLRGWWRTEEGMYINKEQRLTNVPWILHMADATQWGGLGLGWGWGC